MPRAFLCFVVLILDPGGLLAAQEWRWAVPQNLLRERVIGLLDLPEIVAEGCGTGDSKTAPLYDRPSVSARQLGLLSFSATDRSQAGCSNARLTVRRVGGSTDAEVPTSESDYEIPAAIVYEQAGRWFRIALQRGSAWIHRPVGDDLHLYPELLKSKLAYIRVGWDGMLWPTPAAGTTAAITPEWKKDLGDDIAVDVLAVRHIGGEVWVQVQLETERCGRELQGVKPITGWIPAYTATRPSLWFYARGC